MARALDCLVAAGGGPPPHRHLAEDELFTITESISFAAGDEFRPVSSGESVFVPRGTRHVYRNEKATPTSMIAV